MLRLNSSNSSREQTTTKQAHKITSIIASLALIVTFSSCGVNDSGDSGPSLDGDLKVEISSQSDLNYQYTQSLWDGNNYTSTSESGTIESGAPTTFDIEDGDYKGVYLSLSTTRGGSATFQLLNDGNEVAVKSEPDSTGTYFNYYTIKKGDMPDYSELAQ